MTAAAAVIERDWRDRYWSCNDKAQRVAAMTRAGCSAAEIADRLGISARHVTRLRGKPPSAPPTTEHPPQCSPRRAAALEQTVEVAVELVMLLRDEDPSLTWRALSRLNRHALQELAVVLIAMVPVHLTVGELLSWVMDLPAAKDSQL